MNSTISKHISTGFKMSFLGFFGQQKKEEEPHSYCIAEVSTTGSSGDRRYMQVTETMRQIRRRISVFSCSFSLLSTLAGTLAFILRSQKDFLSENKSKRASDSSAEWLSTLSRL